MLEGQDKLINIFKNMSFDELPHTFMLLGDEGCGKHTLSKEIAEQFHLEYNDITENISKDLIFDIETINIPTLYVINILELKEQSMILKFIEDFKQFIYVCLICDNKNLVLETILNRCIIYEFEKYSINFLTEYANFLIDDKNRGIALKVCSTVGQLMKINGTNLVDLQELCTKVATQIGMANVSNVLSTLQQFNFKDLYDKYDVKIFFKLMILTLFDLVKNDATYYTKKYLLTQEYAKRLNNSKFKKEELLASYLVEFWKLSRGI